MRDGWGYINNHCEYDNEAYINDLAAKGIKIIVPEQGQLLLDIDSQEPADALQYKIDKFNRVCQNVLNAHLDFIGPSSSNKPGHYHARLTIYGFHGDPVQLTDMQRVVLQLYFGSDANRELHNFVRSKNECSRPSVLFQGKWKEAE